MKPSAGIGFVPEAMGPFSDVGHAAKARKQSNPERDDQEQIVEIITIGYPALRLILNAANMSKRLVQQIGRYTSMTGRSPPKKKEKKKVRNKKIRGNKENSRLR